MSRKLKILHVIDSGGLYGAEKVVLSLMQEHAKQGLDVELASISEPGWPPKAIEIEAERRGLKWQRFDIQRGIDTAGMQKVVNYAEEQGISVIHSHAYKANILLAMTGKGKRRIPVLATLHGWTSTGWFGRMKPYEWIECALLPRLDRVVAVSKAMTTRTLYAKRLGEKLKVIRNGISTDQVDEVTHEEDIIAVRAEIENFSNGTPVFVMVGRLSPEKDIGTALRAMAHLKNNGQEARLVIFGDGAEKEALDLLAAELSLQEDVLFWGYCGYVRGVLDSFRALIISSLTEGIPLVVLEAMQAGIPAIATRVGGLPEVVVDGSTGILVEPADPKQLSNAIDRFVTNKGFATNCGTAARSHGEQNFDIVTTAEKYLAEYQVLA